MHGLSVLFSKKRDCHTLLQKFIQLRIAKGAPLAAEDAGSMALVPHAEEQPQQVRLQVIPPVGTGLCITQITKVTLTILCGGFVA